MVRHMPSRNDGPTGHEGPRTSRTIRNILSPDIVGRSNRQIVTFPFHDMVGVEAPEFKRRVGLIAPAVQCLSQRKARVALYIH